MSTLKKALNYGVVVTTIIWSVGLMATPIAVGAAVSGDLIKLQCDAGAGVNDPCRAVYYLGADGKRYVFPNEKTYSTWYSDFSGVQAVSSTEMSSYPIGGNVTYRPGVKMVKITTDPKVYAVGQNGSLQWVTTGEIAEALYGADWTSMVEDVSDAFFVNYSIGADVNDASDFDKDAATTSSGNINADKELTTGGTPGGSVSTGSSLTVALAADTPAANLAPQSASRLPFTKFNVTASADGDIVIDSIKVKLTGAVDGQNSKNAFSGIDLLDGNTMLPFDTTSKTFNSNNIANFTRDITIPAGTTMPIYISGNMAASLAARAGEVHALQLDSMVLKGGTVVGALPIVGNGHTINATLTIASATVSRGAFSNASTTTGSPTEVGTTDFTLFSFKIQAGSAENVRFDNIRVFQTGSASFDDLVNVALFNDGTKLVDGVEDIYDSKYMNFSIPGGFQINEGQTKQYLVRADIDDGSGRTVQLAIDRTTDLIITGLESGYSATPTYSGTGSGGTRRALQDNQFTIGGGSVTISKSNEVQATNITIADAQELGAFKFRVEGEPVEVTALTLTVASTVATAITKADATKGYRLVDANGVTVAGPTDLSTALLTVAWTDSFTIQPGEHIFKVVADIDSNSGFASDDTLTVSFTPSAVSIRGETTGDTLTAKPSASISGNLQTFKVATVSVTRNGIPSDSTVIIGADQLLLGSWSFDGTDSGEDVRITAIALAASTSNANNLTLYFDGVAQIPIEDAPSSTDDGATTTFTLGTPLVIAKNTKTTVELKGDISSAASADNSAQFGITSNAAITATGVSTGNTVTASVTADDGAVLSYSGAGTLTMANFNTPSKALILSGTTGVTINSLKLSATNEDIVLDDLTVHIADGSETGTGTGNYKDVSNVSIWNGATKLIESNIPSTGKFKFNFSKNSSDTNYVLIPKDDSVVLTIKVDTATITTQGTDNPATPNADFVIGFGGTNSFKATGVDSGSTSTETYNTSTSTTKILHSSTPVVTLATASNRLGAASTLTNADIRLFAFDVKADSAQNRPVMLYRMGFGITTTTGVNVTTAYLKQEGVAEKVSEADAAVLIDQGTSGGTLTFLFDSPDFSEGDLGEQLEIAAGTTKRFYLNATVAGAAAGDSVTVSLLGDTASAITNNLTGQTASVWIEGTLGKFIWSDDHLNNSGSQDATATAMWFNGHLVDGLEKTVTTTGYTVPF